MKKALLLALLLFLSGITYAAAPLPLKLDFGTASSPVMAGYTRFTATAYSAATGYGWENTSGVYADTRSSGNELEIDMHQIDAEKRFFVDVPNGTYNVTFHFYDAVFGQNGINVDVEGANAISNLSVPSATHITRTSQTNVTDGQLTIRIYSSTGGGMILNGLEVTSTGSTCIENWNCTTWSSCVNGTQTRTCTDSAGCGTTVYKPAEIQSCSTPGQGVIFEDDFEGWRDANPDPLILCDGDDSFSNCRPLDKTEWCGFHNFYNYYGEPDTGVVASEGRLGSNSLKGNIESRVQPESGIKHWLPEQQDELYIRRYIKYDSTWSWWPNQNIHKLARYRHVPDGGSCGDIPTGGRAYIIPAWRWGRMVYGWAVDDAIVEATNDYTWYRYGAGKWILVEDYIKLNTLGSSDGIARVWIDGELVINEENIILRTAAGGINALDLMDNIIYTNAAGSSGVPWFEPEEKSFWADDYVISGNYVGPEPCPSGTQITLENVGACYCGGVPSPTDSSNVYTSGYCCNGSWQANSCGGASDTTPPLTPANLFATAISSSQVNLSWSASTDNVGVTGYRLERCTGASCSNFSQIASPTGTTYNNTGLSASTTYRYRIRAADAAGNLSPYSSIASATTQATSCTENWSCTAWSECTNNQQARTCTDANDCGTTVNKPAETQSCSPPGEGVIFEDDFEGWHDEVPDDPLVLCNPNSNISDCRPAGSEWCDLTNFNEYGLQDSQIVNRGGRMNSNAFVGNVESRVQPHIGLTGWLPDKSHDELYFRWYMKYDETWSWWPNQNTQKLARIGWNTEGLSCPDLQEYIVPKWQWGQMEYRIETHPLIVTSDPKVYWYDYGAGKWIPIEIYIKLNTVGQSNGILTSWINGKKVLHSEEVEFRTSNVHINRINFPDNIIYTNAAGSSGVPWLPPEEKQMWTDDFVVSTNYIGPEPCPNGTEITPENVGACYCGGTPSPTDSSNVYTSGYCCNGSWQTTSCTPAIQCTVNIATPCTISITGGSINSCSQQNLIYQFNATTTVNNTVNGLQASKAYDIKIENTTTGTTQNKIASTNSAGVLQFTA
ncbi:MAG: fibronectin type III domain-containing protein [Candidatus Diapherotrites archaeon]